MSWRLSGGSKPPLHGILKAFLGRANGVSDEPNKAMAVTVGGMTHFGKPIAQEDQELLDRAVECFGDLDKALDWLQSPNVALRGLAPVRVAADPKSRQAVLDELGRIEHGIFA
jgi:hypothetical protein